MKRIRIATLLLTLLLAIPALLHAQIIKGEVFLGANGCQVDGDECYGYKKFGVHAGAGAFKRDSITYNSTYPHAYNLKLNYVEVPLMLYITDKNSVSAGIGVSYGRIVGIDEKNDGISTGIGIGDGHLHWKENEENMPDISGVTNLDQLADIVYSSGFHDTIPIPQVIANSNTYRPHDFNICANIRFRLWEGFHAEMRYQYSLRPIRTRLYYSNVTETLPSQVRLQYNNTFTLRLVYMFNERRSKVNKEDMKKGGQ